VSAAAEPEGADGLAEARDAPERDVLVAADRVEEDGVEAMLEQMLAHPNGEAPLSARLRGVTVERMRPFATAGRGFEDRGQP
jgi:hypothetical protein